MNAKVDKSQKYDEASFKKKSPSLLWYPIKVRVFHQNERCLSCPHPPLSYEGRREQEGSSHLNAKPLTLIEHYGISFLFKVKE